MALFASARGATRATALRFGHPKNWARGRCSDGLNTLGGTCVGALAVAADRGELTVAVVAAADFAWFDAQRAGRPCLGAGRPVGGYLPQVVRVRGAPAALSV